MGLRRNPPWPVSLPDSQGRLQILGIHTRAMREQGAVSLGAQRLFASEELAEATEHFSGAELAGLVRSAASFALARSALSGDVAKSEEGIVTEGDIWEALGECRPALGSRDEVLQQRVPLGIAHFPFNDDFARLVRDLRRFTLPSLVPIGGTPGSGNSNSRVKSMLLVGQGAGAGSTALAAWAAAEASSVRGDIDFCRFVTVLDLIAASGGASADEATRATALVDQFSAATAFLESTSQTSKVAAASVSPAPSASPLDGASSLDSGRIGFKRRGRRALLVLDDIDQICAGPGGSANLDGLSSVLLSTLRALLRTSPSLHTMAQNADGNSRGSGDTNLGPTELLVLATMSSTARGGMPLHCGRLAGIFEEELMVPLLGGEGASQAIDQQSKGDSTLASFCAVLRECSPLHTDAIDECARCFVVESHRAKQPIGVKTVLRLAEQATAEAALSPHTGEEGLLPAAQVDALKVALADWIADVSRSRGECAL